MSAPAAATAVKKETLDPTGVTEAPSLINEDVKLASSASKNNNEMTMNEASDIPNKRGSHRRSASEGPSTSSNNGFYPQFPPAQISYPNNNSSNNPTTPPLPPGAVPLPGSSNRERSYSGDLNLGGGGGVPFAPSPQAYLNQQQHQFFPQQGAFYPGYYPQQVANHHPQAAGGVYSPYPYPPPSPQAGVYGSVGGIPMSAPAPIPQDPNYPFHAAVNNGHMNTPNNSYSNSGVMSGGGGGGGGQQHFTFDSSGGVPAPQNSGGRSKEHRRVRSYSGGGSGFPPPTPATPGTAGRPPRSRSNSGDFSPRDEFLKLSGMSSPSTRNMTATSNSKHSPTGGGASPISPAAAAAGVSMSPQYAAAGTNRGVYNGFDPSLVTGGLTTISTPTGNRARAGSESSDQSGGEAAFLVQPHSSGRKGHRKQGSTRRMHMRQQSAQLFMEDVKGVEQLPSCRDVIWTLLFLFHLLGIVYLGNTYGFEALRYHDEMEDETEVTLIYRNIIYVASLTGIFSISVSALVLFLMTLFVKKTIQVALILTITLSFAWGTIGIGLSPKKVVPATGIIALALSIGYTFISWDRVPFSSSNLNAALSGIKANPGVVLLTFFFQLLALIWSVYFTYVAVGVYDAIEDGDLPLTKNGKVALYAAMAASYYWTFHVFMNVVQVTVAGVIGAWWFTPEGDTTTRKGDLSRSFFRSIFYAFGSVCFGSLFVGPVRVLRQLSALFRPNDDMNSLMCFHQCITFFQTAVTRCVDGVSDIFSPWAFTYIGLYGYNLVDAGRNSAELFEKRGWRTIVSDDLVPNVLLLTSLVVAGVSGLFAHLIENLETLSFSNLGQPGNVSFMMGACVGLVETSVLFGIIGSSVNAVIVCFAASPVDFEQNHQTLSHEMRSAWREVWPGCMDVVDLRVAAANYNMDPSLVVPPVHGSVYSERSPLLRSPA